MTGAAGSGDRTLGWCAQGADVKYIDPTYMIRAVPTNPNDRIYCKVRPCACDHVLCMRIRPSQYWECAVIHLCMRQESH